mgnify:CR=1 FL=1
MTSNKILLICLAFIALTACNAGSKRQTNHHMENAYLGKTGNHHGKYHSGPV